MKFPSDLKAQSAIEYLMTYGWMLLIVGITTGLVFEQTERSCSDSANGFTASSISVENYALDEDSGNLGLILMNNVDTQVEITGITVDYGGESTTENSFEESSISPDESKAYDVGGVEKSSSCNDLELEIVYNISSGSSELSDQKASGSIKGGIAIE